MERIIHDSSKPGRGGNGYDLWVVHSTAAYAESHLVGEQLDDAEAVKEEMTQALLEAIDAALAASPAVRLVHVQRSCGYQWRP